MVVVLIRVSRHSHSRLRAVRLRIPNHARNSGKPVPRCRSRLIALDNYGAHVRRECNSLDVVIIWIDILEQQIYRYHVHICRGNLSWNGNGNIDLDVLRLADYLRVNE